MNINEILPLVQAALTGILASETEDCMYGNTYLDHSGKETVVHSSFPLQPNGQPDYSLSNLPHKLLRTRYQNIAIEAVKLAVHTYREMKKELTPLDCCGGVGEHRSNCAWLSRQS